MVDQSAPTTADDSLYPQLNGMKTQIAIYYLKEATLKQKNATFTPPNIINFFIVYKSDTLSRD